MPHYVTLLAITLAAGSVAAQEFTFRDIAADVGLVKPLEGANAHAAAWGDVDGDGKLDLFIGTFAEKSTGAGVPNMFFWNDGGKFTADPDPALRSTGRGTGSILVDLDNDGLLDLYVTNHSSPRAMPDTAPGRPNLLYRALPGRKWKDVSAESGAVTAGATSRNIMPIDFDGDGLLDLLVVHAVGKSPGRKTTLFRNKGDFKFEVANEKAGIPDDLVGLGACVGDVNNDGWPDIFVGGSNRLFLSQGNGTYKQDADLTKALDWKFAAEDNAPSAGAAFGDIDLDGDLDLVIGHHPKRPWFEPRPIRVYRNLGKTATGINFTEITLPVGLSPIPMKAPHVELRDFDNDGRVDLYTAIVTFNEGKIHPAIWRNVAAGDNTSTGGVKFVDTAFKHRRDFPDDADKATKGTADFYAKLLREKKINYMSTGPSADFDGDGRLDLLLASWWPELPTMLLKNETPSGNWIAVRALGGKGLNSMGLGTKVRAYKPGQAGKPEALIAWEEIQTGYGYTCGQPAVAHLGLGEVETCDLVIEWPYGKGSITLKNQAAGKVVVAQH